MAARKMRVPGRVERLRLVDAVWPEAYAAAVGFPEGPAPRDAAGIPARIWG